jgi:hypothetical protein
MIDDVRNVEPATAIGNAIHAARGTGEQAPELIRELAERANLRERHPRAPAFTVRRRCAKDSDERENQVETVRLSVHDG